MANSTGGTRRKIRLFTGEEPAAQALRPREEIVHVHTVEAHTVGIVAEALEDAAYGLLLLGRDGVATGVVAVVRRMALEIRFDAGSHLLGIALFDTNEQFTHTPGHRYFGKRNVKAASVVAACRGQYAALLLVACVHAFEGTIAQASLVPGTVGLHTHRPVDGHFGGKFVFHSE